MRVKVMDPTVNLIIVEVEAAEARWIADALSETASKLDPQYEVAALRAAAASVEEP